MQPTLNDLFAAIQIIYSLTYLLWKYCSREKKEVVCKATEMVGGHGDLQSVGGVSLSQIPSTKHHRCIIYENIQLSLPTHELLHKVPHRWQRCQVELQLQSKFNSSNVNTFLSTKYVKSKKWIYVAHAPCVVHLIRSVFIDRLKLLMDNSCYYFFETLGKNSRGWLKNYYY